MPQDVGPPGVYFPPGSGWPGDVGNPGAIPVPYPDWHDYTQVPSGDYQPAAPPGDYNPNPPPPTDNPPSPPTDRPPSPPSTTDVLNSLLPFGIGAMTNPFYRVTRRVRATRLTKFLEGEAKIGLKAVSQWWRGAPCDRRGEGAARWLTRPQRPARMTIRFPH